LHQVIKNDEHNNNNTVKAPIISPFGNHLTEFVDTQDEILQDIVTGMNLEKKNDNVNKKLSSSLLEDIDDNNDEKNDKKK